MTSTWTETVNVVPYRRWSDRSKAVYELATAQGKWPRGVKNWSEVESQGELTPQGLVHLHWYNRLGNGRWQFTTKTTSVCKTPRCRKVLIIPLGGENEICHLPRVTMDEARIHWWMKQGHDPAPEQIQNIPWFQEIAREVDITEALNYYNQHGKLPMWMDTEGNLYKFLARLIENNHKGVGSP